jgi:cardiolipin synthase
VGSSNLDPLSLSLNLEANVVMRDRAFNTVLAERLDHLMCNACNEIKVEHVEEPALWRVVRSFFVFHAMRWYPSWANWLPTHAPQLQTVRAAEDAGQDRTV